MPLSRSAALLGALILTCSALAAAGSASLHTQQTVLRVEAGRASPRISDIQAPGALPWKNKVNDRLIRFAIVNGRRMPLQWKLRRAADRVDPDHISFVYEAARPHLRLTWEWVSRASAGPIEHNVRIDNLEAGEVWIPLQASFNFKFSVPARTPLDHLYVDKGAGRPSQIGTHHVPVPVPYKWQGTSSTYAVDEGTREIIPFYLLQRTANDGPMSKRQDGWYVGVEFSGRTSLSLVRDKGAVSGVVGLDPNPAPFLTRLPPKGQFTTPPIFVGAFSGDSDSVGNVLRPWIRKVLGNPTTWANPSYPLLVNNSWGSGMQVDEALAYRMIQDSAELGLEMFHLDAGWFRGVGDWYPDPKKFPHGLAALSDEAHRHGLLFGIWVNWAEAGTAQSSLALNVDAAPAKDWIVAGTPSGWKPEPFVGRTIDLGLPAAKQYADSELKRMVSSYKLDMLEHDGYVVARACAEADHPHAPPPAPYPSVISGSGVALPLAPNSTDVSYHATRAYYELYAGLRRRNPSLLFEICNDGGRMVDFGSASHGDYFSITDSYDPVSNRRAFFDASHLLPTAMLEDYVEKWPTPNIESFRSMLRSGMMGWLTVMQDTSSWTAEQHAAAKEEFALYKSVLRPFIRDADLYHISQRPDGVHWDAMEYVLPQHGTGVVYVFRGSDLTEKTHRFPLRGVLPGRRYRLRFHDHSSPDQTIDGKSLLTRGLEVHLPESNSSELVFIDEAGEPTSPLNEASEFRTPR